MKVSVIERRLNDKEFSNKFHELKSGEQFVVTYNDGHKLYKKANHLMINFWKNLNNEELEASGIKVIGTQQEKAPKAAKAPKVEKKTTTEEIIFMQSKSGMFHISNGVAFDKNISKCQSYNYDRINELNGIGTNKLPEGAKLCKKCATHI